MKKTQSALNMADLMVKIGKLKSARAKQDRARGIPEGQIEVWAPSEGMLTWWRRREKLLELEGLVRDAFRNRASWRGVGTNLQHVEIRMTPAQYRRILKLLGFK